jgi:putative membrane protein
VVTRGLLERREMTVPTHRVQVVEITQTILRRILGRAAVKVQTAAGKLAVPLVAADETESLLRRLVHIGPLPPLRPVPLAARRRLVVRRAVPATLASGMLTAAAWPAGLVSAVLIPLAVAWGWAAWRGLADGASHDVVVSRGGALYRTLEVVPTAKAQSIRVRSSPFQRRSGLATLHIDVAGGSSASVPEIAAGRAAELAALLTSPTSVRADERAVRARR